VGGFRLSWAGMGPLVLMGGRGFARHGPPRILGLVVVAENGSDLVLVLVFFYYLFIICVCGYGFGSGGC